MNDLTPDAAFTIALGAGYLAAFAVIGTPNNAYWGLLVTPLLALGWVALPVSLRDLFRAISRAK